jgi:hypothetical protein
MGLGQPAEIVQAIYVRTLMRQPSNEETQSILEWISGYQGSAQQSQPSAETWSAAIRMLMASNEFHFID